MIVRKRHNPPQPKEFSPRYSMDDPQYCQYIKQEFYWPGGEMPNSDVIQMMRKYNANRIGVDKNGFTTLQAPLLVALRTNKNNDFLLMLVRKIVNCRSVPKGLNPSTHRAESHQVALVSRTDLRLFGIPNATPGMCFEPLPLKEGGRKINNRRVSPNQWLVPEICNRANAPGEQCVVWNGIRELLGLPENAMHSYDVIHRIQWATGYWDKNGPIEDLTFPLGYSFKDCCVKNFCTQRHPTVIPSRTNADRLFELKTEGWIPAVRECAAADYSEAEDNSSHSLLSLPSKPYQPKRGRKVTISAEKTKKRPTPPADARDASPVRPAEAEEIRPDLEHYLNFKLEEYAREFKEKLLEFEQRLNDPDEAIVELRRFSQASLANITTKLDKMEKHIQLMESAIETNQAALITLHAKPSCHHLSRKVPKPPTSKSKPKAD